MTRASRAERRLLRSRPRLPERVRWCKLFSPCCDELRPRRLARPPLLLRVRVETGDGEFRGCISTGPHETRRVFSDVGVELKRCSRACRIRSSSSRARTGARTEAEVVAGAGSGAKVAVAAVARARARSRAGARDSRSLALICASACSAAVAAVSLLAVSIANAADYSASCARRYCTVPCLKLYGASLQPDNTSTGLS